MKTKVNVEVALDVLERTVPELLAAQDIRPDVCVGATRIACLALAEVGIKASPLTTRVDAMSPRYRQAVERGELEAAKGDSHLLHRIGAEGGWTVVIGHPDNEERLRPDGSRGFNGHLVALVERRWVLDLTIQQANRPAKNMIFEPHHFAVTPGFMGGAPTIMVNERGCALVYVRIENNTYAVAPDWTKVRRDDRIVRETARRLRQTL
jgi:hypothetical protein